MDMELLLVLLLFLAIPVVLPAPVRLELARVDANLTGHDLIRRAVQRSLDRPGVAVPRPGGGGGAATAADGGRRSSSSAAASAPVVAGGGEYLVKLGIGTPQHFFSAAIDTATDLVWMQCQPCVSCYRQLDPVFNPRLSSSYAVVPCSSDTCVQFDEHRHVPHSSSLTSEDKHLPLIWLLRACAAGAAPRTTTRASTRTGTAGTA